MPPPSLRARQPVSQAASDRRPLRSAGRGKRVSSPISDHQHLVSLSVACSSASPASALPKPSPKFSGWELKNGEWVRRLKDPLAAADAGEGADCSCVGGSPSPIPSPTRTPFNSPLPMLVARRTIPAGEMFGSYSGALTPLMDPSLSVRGHDDTKVRHGWLTACT